MYQQNFQKIYFRENFHMESTILNIDSDNELPPRSNYKNDYQEKWESRSSVRTRPRKIIDFNQKGYFFPEDKQLLFLEEEVIKLGAEIKEKILLQSFYKYLNDIVNLEIKLINSVCNKIIYEDLAVKYNDEIKLNAHTIIIDEYYHVYVAQDMMLQLKYQYPDIQRFNYPVSDSYNAVMVVKEKLDSKYHDIFKIIAVCIFETTLVRELIEFFNSENVHPSIKCYVNDHMNDEAKHYGFFFDLLCYTWNGIPKDFRLAIGTVLGEFIKLYLNINSEKIFNKNLLSDLMQDKERAARIVENIYKGFEINPEIPIVKNVLSVLQKSRLIDHPCVKISLQNVGLSP